MCPGFDSQRAHQWLQWVRGLFVERRLRHERWRNYRDLIGRCSSWHTGLPNYSVEQAQRRPVGPSAKGPGRRAHVLGWFTKFILVTYALGAGAVVLFVVLNWQVYGASPVGIALYFVGPMAGFTISLSFLILGQQKCSDDFCISDPNRPGLWVFV